MRIAVTYENGEVFQHFGKTEMFKLYEVSGGEVVSTDVIGTDGTGHEALAGFLADKGVDVVICGGMTPQTDAAMEYAGITDLFYAIGDCNGAGNLEVCNREAFSRASII